jgi:hypothetical protein
MMHTLSHHAHPVPNESRSLRGRGRAAAAQTMQAVRCNQAHGGAAGAARPKILPLGCEPPRSWVQQQGQPCPQPLSGPCCRSQLLVSSGAGRLGVGGAAQPPQRASQHGAHEGADPEHQHVLRGAVALRARQQHSQPQSMNCTRAHER